MRSQISHATVFSKAAPTLAMVLVASLSSAAQAQWWWPPQACMIEPEQPTTADPVTITLAGEWPNSCVPNGSYAAVVGQEVYFDVYADYPPGTMCADMITPWGRSETVGPLAAGTYTVIATLYDALSAWPPPSPVEVCSFVVQPCCWFNWDCPPDEYCAKAVGDCYGAGTCELRPEVCPLVYIPVCGCNGLTYSNDCLAAMWGVSVDYPGICDYIPPELCSAVSCKTHGAESEFKIDLPLHPPEEAAVECRWHGPEEVIFTFSEDVLAADGVPDETEVNLSCHGVPCGTIESVSIVGDEMTVEMGGVPDATCLAITLDGIIDLAGNFLAGDYDVHIRVLLGDTNADGAANLIDMAQVKSVKGGPPDETTARFDLNCDGFINLIDMALAKSRNGGLVACP